MNGVAARLADRFDIAADTLYRIAASDQKAGEHSEQDDAGSRHFYLVKIGCKMARHAFEGGEGMRAGPMLLSSAAGGR